MSADILKSENVPYPIPHRQRNSDGRIISVILLGASFCSFCTLLIFMLLRLPSLPIDQKAALKFPKNVEDLKTLGSTLSDYQDSYYWEILIFISVTYIFLQSFMIPGSALISILLGYLFPFPIALAIVALCSAVGSTCCYLLVGFIGSQLLLHLIPKQIEQCRLLIQRHRHAMFFCICLLRICPLVPNWLVNVSSPIVEIPLLHFFWGTFVGVVPLSLVFVKAGTVLQELTDFGMTSLTSVYTLGFLAIASLLPFLFQKQIRQWIS
ncbi:Transmembrane protein 41B [Clonorchis sinensis]|uniref:Transmembrane protein 41B n=1 Tax=Clonorchis sinensis TaxID=79923 RepID=A0A8T1MBK9_CLOSI|nr:Transmembrane protein 41B [Clonorchis sinensis]